jgi:predicted dehydrogenase
MIGAGFIAKRHLQNLLGFADVTVAAVADSAPGRAADLVRHCAARAYTDYRAMLDNESLDALYLCVPPFAHGPLEQDALDRRLPFFVEKPLATEWATAAAIAKQVATQNLVTAVGYHWRYLDTTEEAQALLARQPARLALGYWLDGTPPVPWWGQSAQSGGQMIEQTTHIFDLARLLVGEVTTVYAAGARTLRPDYREMDICEVTTATLHFASGALGNLASTCLLGWPHRIGLHLFCDRLVIELSEFDMMVDQGHGRPLRRAEGDPFIREDRAFIDAVQGQPNRIRVDYAEALQTHALTVAATRSVQAGHTIALKSIFAAEEHAHG